jgi:hypothetical protein
MPKILKMHPVIKMYTKATVLNTRFCITGKNKTNSFKRFGYFFKFCIPTKDIIKMVIHYKVSTFDKDIEVFVYTL